MLSVWARKRTLCIVVSCRHFSVPCWCSFQQDSHNGANGQDFMGAMKGVSYLVHPYAGFIRIPHVCFISFTLFHYDSLCFTMFYLLSEMWSTVSRANWCCNMQEPLVQGAWSQPPQFWGWCLSDALNNAFECRTSLCTSWHDNTRRSHLQMSHDAPWCPMMSRWKLRKSTTKQLRRLSGPMGWWVSWVGWLSDCWQTWDRRCDSVQSAFSRSKMFGQCLGTVEVHFLVHTLLSHA